MGHIKNKPRISRRDRIAQGRAMVKSGEAPTVEIALAMMERPDKIQCYMCLDEPTGEVMDTITIDDGNGEQKTINTNEIVRVQDYYISYQGRYFGDGRLYNTSNVRTFILINAKLDKQHRLIPKKDTEKLRKDLENWAYMQKHNAKCKLFPSGMCSLVMEDYRLAAVGKPNTKGYENCVIPPNVKDIKTTYIYHTQKYTNLEIKSTELTRMPEMTELGIAPVGTYVVTEGIKRISGIAFHNCLEMTKVILPKSLRSISGRGFGRCDHLEEVEFNGPLKFLGSAAFEGCRRLKELNLPNGIETVDLSCVRGCNNLEKLVLPKSVNNIIFNGNGKLAGPETELWIHVRTANRLEPGFRDLIERGFKVRIYG